MTGPASSVSRRTPVRPIAGAVAAATMTALAWALVERPSVPPGEERVFRLLNDAPSALWPLLWPVMQLGNLAAPAAVGAFVAVRTRRWRPVTVVLVAGYGAWAVSQLLKDVVRRGRPSELLADVVLREPVEGLGFVSGHAAISAAVAAGLWPHLGRGGRLVTVALAGLVGAGRVYAGAHLPLDVVGGQALGVLTGLGVTVLIRARTCAGSTAPS